MSEHEPAGNKVVIPDYWPDPDSIGSASTLEMDEEAKRRAAEREREKPPTGFAAGDE